MSAADLNRQANPLLLPLRELSRRLRQGELSPVELTELCLERLERIGPRYNAVVTVTRERALAQARRAESELRQGYVRGPLHGIPYGAKDLLATSGGIPTTWGFEPYKAQLFESDAAVIERLEQAGAILAAKLAMVELAGGMKYEQPAKSSYLGGCINPWHEGSWSGGSSSGPGAAVAAGLVPFAIGSETHGSITSPSAFCGLAGLRPGFGRVSRRGAMALSWTLDKLGPMCHSADDCGLVLEAIAGPDPLDESTLVDAFTYGPRVPAGGKWKLATLSGMDVTDPPEQGAHFRRALEVLAPVAEITEDQLPEHPYHEAVMTILFAEAGAAFGHLADSGLAARLTAPECRQVPYALQTIPATAYVNALRARTQISRDVTPWLDQYDAIVTPTLKKVAPPLDTTFPAYWGNQRRLEITGAGNLLGWPCITVPSGFGERGLPTGIQFVGRPGSENRLLSIARWYQDQTQWHLSHPAIAQA